MRPKKGLGPRKAIPRHGNRRKVRVLDKPLIAPIGDRRMVQVLEK